MKAIASGFSFVFSVAAAAVFCGVSTDFLIPSASAQGLSGIPQRLEEKVAVSFDKKVAGILNTHCGQCHVQEAKGNFKMSSFAELMRARGVVTPGNPAQSKLFTQIDSGEMPPKQSMPQEEKDVIKRWIEQGAKFDGSSETSSLASFGGSSGSAGNSSGGPPAGYGGGPPAGYGGDNDYGDTSGMDDDMAMQAYYGGGYGERPGGRSAAGTPSGDVIDTYASPLISLLGSLNLTGLFLPEKEITVESGPLLKQESEQAFKAGHQAMALELMFGHMASEYPDSLVDIQSVKYSPLLKRPIWNLRWGVSMFIRGDGARDPKPIREGASPARSLAGRGGGRGQQPANDSDYEQSMAMSMQDYPDSADAGMGDEYEMQMQMQNQMMGGGDPRGSGRRASGGQPQGPKIPERKMLSDEAQEALDKHLGLVAKVISEEFNKRFQQGDFGPLFAALTQPPIDDNPPRNAPAAAAAVNPLVTVSLTLNELLTETGDPSYPMWQPGLVYLGEGTAEEMMGLAKQAKLDLILHFDVILKPGRNDAVQNISRCRVLNVTPAPDSQGRVRSLVVTSKGMDSNEASQLASAGRMTEREYVEEQLSSLLAIIDRDVKVVDLPALPPEVARRRVATIISGPESRSLRTLAEIRLYEARELISQNEVEAAFDIVGGSDGLLLLHGPTRERLETARRWALESVSSAGPR